MGKGDTLATVWEIPDHLWGQIHPVIQQLDPPKSTGRRRADPRQMLNGIIFRMRSGCQWNHLPRTLGDDSTIHRTFQRWVELGVLEGIWAVLVEECDELSGVDWEWQAADCAMGKVPVLGARSGPQPHRPRQGREQTKHPGRRWRRTVERGGGGGQCPRHKLLALTLDSIVVERPDRLDGGCSICAWTRDTTIRRGVRRWRNTATGDTSGAVRLLRAGHHHLGPPCSMG